MKLLYWIRRGRSGHCFTRYQRPYRLDNARINERYVLVATVEGKIIILPMKPHRLRVASTPKVKTRQEAI